MMSFDSLGDRVTYHNDFDSLGDRVTYHNDFDSLGDRVWFLLLFLCLQDLSQLLQLLQWSPLIALS